MDANYNKSVREREREREREEETTLHQLIEPSQPYRHEEKWPINTPYYVFG